MSDVTDTKSLLPKDSDKPASDIRLLGRAVREGWNIPKPLKTALVQRLAEVVARSSVEVPDAKGNTCERVDVADANATAAGRVLVAMDQIDQDDYQYGDKNQRLDDGKATERLSMEPVILRKAIQPPES